ncbi:MAG TPA: UvrB/UvrC motif-containing protein [Candidatus Paceibacterota bacterium]|nr:UvrB/UvrC motif-containing protein [Candidatus Paceibacterota bacterium]
MSMVFNGDNIKKLPDEPGVYFFLDENGQVLYVGKATSLQSRVKSYLQKDILESRGPIIVQLMEKAKKIDFRQTDSVLEAVILEAAYIKKLKPRYNTREKSDKSFNYVVITKEEFPRVLIMRERELLMEKIPAKNIKYRFGPFPQGTILREAMKIVRKIFPFRDKCAPGQGKPCFNAQIGLCPGVCNGRITKAEYAKTIHHLKLFFEGKKKTLLKTLEREMKEAAKKQEFEKAQETKRKIFALRHIQDVSLLKRQNGDDEFDQQTIRLEGYDIAHVSGKFLVGVMTVIENGEAKKSDYRKFRIKSFSGSNDTRALQEVLNRRLGHPEWPLPELFVIDGGKAQQNAALEVLREADVQIPVVSVVKDEHHRPREIFGDPKIRRAYHDQILLANSEAHRFAVQYHRQIREKIPDKPAKRK